MFFVEMDGNILAEMVYTMPSPNRMIIEHTEVSDELRGKNVGDQLVPAYSGGICKTKSDQNYSPLLVR